MCVCLWGVKELTGMLIPCVCVFGCVKHDSGDIFTCLDVTFLQTRWCYLNAAMIPRQDCLWVYLLWREQVGRKHWSYIPEINKMFARKCILFDLLITTCQWISNSKFSWCFVLFIDKHAPLKSTKEKASSLDPADSWEIRANQWPDGWSIENPGPQLIHYNSIKQHLTLWLLILAKVLNPNLKLMFCKCLSCWYAVAKS